MVALIICYDFPPYVSVGSLRPYGWYNYLHEYGVHPVIVTRQWDNRYKNHLDYIAPSNSPHTLMEESEHGTIIRTPYFPNFSNRLLLKHGEKKLKILRKLISAYYEAMQWLFLIGPKSQLYFAAEKYLKTHTVDVIIATGEPFILFRYASKLSKKYQVSWIADYRDPWTQNITTAKNRVIKKWNTFFEKKTLRNASTIFTVSELLKTIISTIIKNKKIHILPNGYDTEKIENLKAIRQQQKILNIAFAGTICPWHPIVSFISVMENVMKEKPTVKLKLNFYGINTVSDLNELLSKKFPYIKQHIHIYPKMPNNLLLRELAKCNLMLSFNDYSIMGTKIYDYIGIARTILLCYANDPEALELKKRYYFLKEEKGFSNHLQEDLLRETNAGYVVKDATHLYHLLNELYNEFSINGRIPCNSKNTEKYSRKFQTQKLADIIHAIN